MNTSSTKLCKNCKQDKAISDFYPRRAVCKPCVALKQKQVQLANTTKCAVTSCARITATRGTRYCEGHKQRLRSYGELREDIPIDMKNCFREAKGFKTQDGYKAVKNPEHPNSWKNGYIFEHTLVMSEHLERPLFLGENVHHVNGVRDDNRLENLELWSSSQPAGQRVLDKIQWAKELLTRYEPEALCTVEN